jgi:hypothetical protein
MFAQAERWHSDSCSESSLLGRLRITRSMTSYILFSVSILGVSECQIGIFRDLVNIKLNGVRLTDNMVW